MDAGRARSCFAAARVARLATIDAEGRPHVVPIVFALISDVLCFAVDAKPKSGAPLRRLANIRANPAVSVLVDHFDEDWEALWWARADGTARIVDAAAPQAAAALEALIDRYPQYRLDRPPGPIVLIDVYAWSGWSASDPR